MWKEKSVITKKTVDKFRRESEVVKDAEKHDTTGSQSVKETEKLEERAESSTRNLEEGAEVTKKIIEENKEPLDKELEERKSINPEQTSSDESDDEELVARKVEEENECISEKETIHDNVKEEMSTNVKTVRKALKQTRCCKHTRWFMRLRMSDVSFPVKCAEEDLLGEEI